MDTTPAEATPTAGAPARGTRSRLLLGLIYLALVGVVFSLGVGSLGGIRAQQVDGAAAAYAATGDRAGTAEDVTAYRVVWTRPGTSAEAGAGAAGGERFCVEMLGRGGAPAYHGVYRAGTGAPDRVTFGPGACLAP